MCVCVFQARWVPMGQYVFMDSVVSGWCGCSFTEVAGCPTRPPLDSTHLCRQNEPQCLCSCLDLAVRIVTAGVVVGLCIGCCLLSPTLCVHYRHTLSFHGATPRHDPTITTTTRRIPEPTHARTDCVQVHECGRTGSDPRGQRGPVQSVVCHLCHIAAVAVPGRGTVGHTRHECPYTAVDPGQLLVCPTSVCDPTTLPSESLPHLAHACPQSPHIVRH